jgi:hypothetical protein
MAATNERVMEMVRKEIEKNPEVSSQELFERAKKMDSGIGRLSVRQFHASYPLQIKRKMKGARRGGRGRPRASVPAGRAGRPPKTASRAGRGRKGATRAAQPGRSAAAPAGIVASSGNGAGRDAIRSILIQFAGEVAAAEGKADVVQVIGGMDRYVDRVMQAAGR